MSDHSTIDAALYEKIRSIVEGRLGPGSLSLTKFDELCAEGARVLERSKIDMHLKDRVGERIAELEQRVERLESKRR